MADKAKPLTVNEFVARMRKGKDSGLDPTKPELIAYARYLGIDAVADGDLMWISEEALIAPVPSEWTEHHDSGNRIFYYNVKTQASSWTHPLEQAHRDTYKRIVNFRTNLSQQEQLNELENQRQECEKLEKDTHKELRSWSEHTDETGHKFYYHAKTKSSMWTDPRPAQCHLLYLQMKCRRVLEQHCGRQSGHEPERLRVPMITGPSGAKASKHSEGSRRDRNEDSMGEERFERRRNSDQRGGDKDGFGRSDRFHGGAPLSEHDRRPSPSPDIASGFASAEDDDSDAGGKKKKKKKKKKRDKDKMFEEEGPVFGGGRHSLGGGDRSPRRGMPQMPVLDEVRSVLGLPGGPPGGGQHHGHGAGLALPPLGNNLPPLGNANMGLPGGGLPPISIDDRMRSLPEPGGHGSMSNHSHHGHRPVKLAGLRLQPLQPLS